MTMIPMFFPVELLDVVDHGAPLGKGIIMGRSFGHPQLYDIQLDDGAGLLIGIPRDRLNLNVAEAGGIKLREVQ